MQRLIDAFDTLVSFKHRPESTQPILEGLFGLICLCVLGFFGWIFFSNPRLTWKEGLFIWSGFMVIWLGPVLWEAFVAWIYRCLHRKESR